MLATDKKRKSEITLFLIKEHIATQSHTHHIIKGTEPESEQTSDPAVNFQEIKMTSMLKLHHEDAISKTQMVQTATYQITQVIQQKKMYGTEKR